MITKRKRRKKVTYLISVPAMSLVGKVIGLGKRLQTLRKFEGLAICKKREEDTPLAWG